MPPRPIKDRSERLVYDYLLRRGLEVVHHPDREHNPPDFAIDGRIGIEVRRLNQHWRDGQTHVGIELREHTLYSLVEEVLEEFGAPTDDGSYWVACGFQNPVPEPKAFKKLLRNALRERITS